MNDESTDVQVEKTHSGKAIFRLCVRAVILAASIIAALNLWGPGWLAFVLPAMSPFLAVCSSIAIRSLNVLFLISMPVAALSLIRGRWFCRNMCPLGLLAEYAGKLRPHSKSKFKSLPRLGPYLVMFALGSAIVGYPFFLWMDPLSIFNGFISAWRKPIAVATVLPAIGFILVLLMSVWRPNAWCYRFCPLGFSQEILGRAGRYLRTRKRDDSGDGGRRWFLAALFGGIAGVVARKAMSLNPCARIRPPGSIEEDQFTAICARCGNCIRVCPQKIIHPDMGNSGVGGLLTPVIEIKENYCSEWCNECNKVCPTNAIAHISLEHKQTVSMGTARIDKSLCLAWKNREHCVVCDEYCPYHAIKVVKDDRIPCPEVDPEICRGCGLCQTVCPAEEVAIVVHAHPQKLLKPVKL